jgi:hypothetical protein
VTDTTLAAKLDRDRFLVNQKHRSWMKSKYYVFDEAGGPLFYVERPVKPLRRSDITIYHDDTRSAAALTIRQDHGYAALRRQYTLIGSDSGDAIAHYDRDNIRSLFRRAWTISSPDGTVVAGAREDTAWIAAIRRIFEWIPYVSILAGFVRTNFRLHVVGDGGVETRVGAFNRKFSIGDKYALDLTDDPQRLLDRRIAVALGILLDTGEAR